MVGPADRAQGGEARAQGQAVGQDVAGAGLTGRHRLSPKRPACRRISTRSAYNLVGYGCTTCIGNSGPSARAGEEAVNDADLVVCRRAVGNRNFEAASTR